jgi:hypothetical protein
MVVYKHFLAKGAFMSDHIQKSSTINELSENKNHKTTLIYTHVLNCRRQGLRSPADSI